ncbi:MAG: hypothetical protein U0894_19600 [Pirellulales bacterium]
MRPFFTQEFPYEGLRVLSLSADIWQAVNDVHRRVNLAISSATGNSIWPLPEKPKLTTGNGDNGQQSPGEPCRA